MTAQFNTELPAGIVFDFTGRQVTNIGYYQFPNDYPKIIYISVLPKQPSS